MADVSATDLRKDRIGLFCSKLSSVSCECSDVDISASVAVLVIYSLLLMLVETSDSIFSIGSST